MSNIGIDLGGTKMLVACKNGDELLTKKYKTGKEIFFNEILHVMYSHVWKE